MQPSLIDAMKNSPGLERKGSMPRLAAPQSAVIGAMKNTSGLERKGSVPRLSATERRPSIAKSTLGSATSEHRPSTPRLAGGTGLDRRPSIARLPVGQKDLERRQSVSRMSFAK
jgi:hypothetical protein